MSKEYSTYFYDLKDLELNKEIGLTIRDLTPGIGKYDARYVKAIVSESLKKGMEKLWVRYGAGSTLVSSPYGLKITQEVGEYDPTARVSQR